MRACYRFRCECCPKAIGSIRARGALANPCQGANEAGNALYIALCVAYMYDFPDTPACAQSSIVWAMKIESPGHQSQHASSQRRIYCGASRGRERGEKFEVM